MAIDQVTFHIYGRTGQLMTVATDSMDFTIPVPATPNTPTEVQLVSHDQQPIWISWTGVAGAAEWTKLFPYDSPSITVPSGATNLYVRKPILRGLDKWGTTTTNIFGDERDKGDDKGVCLQVGWAIRK